MNLLRTIALLALAAPAAAFSNGQAADLVLGQPDFLTASANTGGLSASSLYYPYRLGSDGTRLTVPDAYNHRVLLWNSLPASNQQAADLVLGQAGFASNLANRGGTVAADTLNQPTSARIEEGKLVVADYYNNRVLIWNAVPTSSGQAADVVVGQADFVSNGINRGNGAASPSADSLYWPASARIRGGKLFILDTYNHRLLIYNSVPTSNGASADLVLGQASFTTNAGAFPATPAGLLYPNDVETDGTRLYVVDANNNRVVGWSSFPTANGQAADFVLGQTGLSSSGAGTGAAGLYAMNSVLLDGGDLYVSDYGNNRLLRYSPAPASTHPSAVEVLGQANFSAVAANRGGAVAADTLHWCYGMVMAGGALWVSDLANNRILRYTAPSATPTPTPTASATATATPSVSPTFSATRTPSPTPSITPPATATATPTATPSPTAGPAQPTPAPTSVRRDDHRVDCHPNFVRGRGQAMRVQVRSYSGGQCSLKVNRGNGRVLADLWHGALAPQQIHAETWDTRDSAGDECPSGVYYVVFKDGDGAIQLQKILIVR